MKTKFKEFSRLKIYQQELALEIYKDVLKHSITLKIFSLIMILLYGAIVVSGFGLILKDYYQLSFQIIAISLLLLVAAHFCVKAILIMVRKEIALQVELEDYSENKK